MPAGVATLSAGEIVTAAAQELRDPEFSRFGFGKPFYMSACQRGLEEMNFATQFWKQEFIAPIPDNLVLQLPQDLTSTDQIYLFNGDNCDISLSTILYVKPNMQSLGGAGYVAQNKGWNLDAMQWSSFLTQIPPGCLYFAGERMGVLYMSPACAQFSKIFVQYSGLGVECFGEDFRVPHWAREAITDFVIQRVALGAEREDPQFLGRVIARKDTQLTVPQGSWAKAIIRYKRMDKKTRYDTAMYNFRFGHYR